MGPPAGDDLMIDYLSDSDHWWGPSGIFQ
ncbi:MAG: hypothetical protein JWN20_102, partial [Jatrophihabitantaceae bacterium]|nr:hypothetical protein [Jatrophihabitantaceae bacterium]